MIFTEQWISAMSTEESSFFGSHCGLVVRDDPFKGRCIFAERQFSVGEDLFHEHPYAAVLYDEHYDEHVASRCHHTHETASKLLRWVSSILGRQNPPSDAFCQAPSCTFALSRGCVHVAAVALR